MRGALFCGTATEDVFTVTAGVIVVVGGGIAGVGDVVTAIEDVVIRLREICCSTVVCLDIWVSLTVLLLKRIVMPSPRPIMSLSISKVSCSSCSLTINP